MAHPPSTSPSQDDVDDLTRLSALVLDAAGIVSALAQRWNLPHLVGSTHSTHAQEIFAQSASTSASSSTSNNRHPGAGPAHRPALSTNTANTNFTTPPSSTSTKDRYPKGHNLNDTNVINSTSGNGRRRQRSSPLEHEVLNLNISSPPPVNSSTSPIPTSLHPSSSSHPHNPNANSAQSPNPHLHPNSMHPTTSLLQNASASPNDRRLPSAQSGTEAQIPNIYLRSQLMYVANGPLQVKEAGGVPERRRSGSKGRNGDDADGGEGGAGERQSLNASANINSSARVRESMMPPSSSAASTSSPHAEGSRRRPSTSSPAEQSTMARDRDGESVFIPTSRSEMLFAPRASASHVQSSSRVDPTSRAGLESSLRDELSSRASNATSAVIAARYNGFNASTTSEFVTEQRERAGSSPHPNPDASVSSASGFNAVKREMLEGQREEGEGEGESGDEMSLDEMILDVVDGPPNTSSLPSSALRNVGFDDEDDDLDPNHNGNNGRVGRSPVQERERGAGGVQRYHSSSSLSPMLSRPSGPSSSQQYPHAHQAFAPPHPAQKSPTDRFTFGSGGGSEAGRFEGGRTASAPHITSPAGPAGFSLAFQERQVHRDPLNHPSLHPLNSSFNPLNSQNSASNINNGGPGGAGGKNNSNQHGQVRVLASRRVPFALSGERARDERARNGGERGDGDVEMEDDDGDAELELEEEEGPSWSASGSGRDRVREGERTREGERERGEAQWASSSSSLRTSALLPPPPSSSSATRGPGGGGERERERERGPSRLGSSSTLGAPNAGQSRASLAFQNIITPSSIPIPIPSSSSSHTSHLNSASGAGPAHTMSQESFTSHSTAHARGFSRSDSSSTIGASGVGAGGGGGGRGMFALGGNGQPSPNTPMSASTASSASPTVSTTPAHSTSNAHSNSNANAGASANANATPRAHHPRRGAVPLHERQCSECGKPGRYKDGKSVEKWGPGPEGPGTVCDKCRKKMKRQDKKGPLSVPGVPPPAGIVTTPLSATSSSSLSSAPLSSATSTNTARSPLAAQQARAFGAGITSQSAAVERGASKPKTVSTPSSEGLGARGTTSSQDVTPRPPSTAAHSSSGSASTSGSIVGADQASRDVDVAASGVRRETQVARYGQLSPAHLPSPPPSQPSSSQPLQPQPLHSQPLNSQNHQQPTAQPQPRRTSRPFETLSSQSDEREREQEEQEREAADFSALVEAADAMPTLGASSISPSARLSAYGGYLSGGERERGREKMEFRSFRDVKLSPAASVSTVRHGYGHGRGDVDTGDEDGEGEVDAEGEVDGEGEEDLVGEWSGAPADRRSRAISSASVSSRSRMADVPMRHLPPPLRSSSSYLSIGGSNGPSHPLSDVRSSSQIPDNSSSRSSTTTPIPPPHIPSLSSARHDLPSLSSVMDSQSDAHPAKRAKMDDSGSSDYSRGRSREPVSIPSSSALGAAAKERRRAPSFSPSPPPPLPSRKMSNFQSRPGGAAVGRDSASVNGADRSSSHGTLPVGDGTGVMSDDGSGSSTAVDGGSGSGSWPGSASTKHSGSGIPPSFHLPSSSSMKSGTNAHANAMDVDVIYDEPKPTLSSSVLGKRPRRLSVDDELLQDLIADEPASRPKSHSFVYAKPASRDAADEILELAGLEEDERRPTAPKVAAIHKVPTFRSRSQASSGSSRSRSRSRSRSSSPMHMQVKRRDLSAVPYGERHSVSLQQSE